MALDVDVLTWRVLDLCNSLLTPTFAEQDPGSRSVREDMTSNWLTAIARSKNRTASWIALDLVGHENGHVELWTGN